VLVIFEVINFWLKT